MAPNEPDDAERAAYEQRVREVLENPPPELAARLNALHRNHRFTVYSALAVMAAMVTVLVGALAYFRGAVAWGEAFRVITFILVGVSIIFQLLARRAWRTYLKLDDKRRFNP